MNEDKLLNPSKIRKSKGQIFLELTVGAVLMSVATFYFVIYAQLTSAGLSGIANGITYTINDILINHGILHGSREIADSIVYWIVYWIANIPIIYLTMKWFSRKFLMYSIYFFVINFISTMLFAWIGLPLINLDASTNPIDYKLMALIYAVIGGAIYGISSGMAFRAGACSLGLDPVAKHMSWKYDINIASVLLAITAVNVTIWTLVRGFTNPAFAGQSSFKEYLQNTLLSVGYIGTWIFIGTYSAVTGIIYKSNKKVQIFVSSTKVDEISDYLNSIDYHRGHTISHVQGGYSKQERKTLFMIVNIQEVYDAVEKIAAIDGKAFITINEILRVYDVRDWRALTDEDKSKERERMLKENKRKDKLSKK